MPRSSRRPSMAKDAGRDRSSRVVAAGMLWKDGRRISRKGKRARQEGWKVPLSEDEQRILSEIEAKLYESDPGLARDIADTTIYTHAYRNLKWGLLDFFLGLVMLVLTLSVNFVLSFGGFLIMLISAITVERNTRRMGKAGLDQITQSMRTAGLRDYFGSSSQRMRDRFKRDEQ